LTENVSAESLDWQPVPGTNDWIAHTLDGVVRIIVRDPSFGAVEGPRYVLSGARGEGYFESWDDAVYFAVTGCLLRD
jgi:hypothetical protein